jgi:hypothetical protein
LLLLPARPRGWRRRRRRNRGAGLRLADRVRLAGAHSPSPSDQARPILMHGSTCHGLRHPSVCGAARPSHGVALSAGMERVV